MVKVSWLELFRIKVQEGFVALKILELSFLLLIILVISRSRRVNKNCWKGHYFLKNNLKTLLIYLTSTKMAY